MKCLLSSLALCMALIMQPSQADTIKECNEILDGAQKFFRDLFPTDPPTEFLGNWCFRAYPLGLFAGLNLVKSVEFDVGAYVLGPPFGNTPTFIGSTQQVKDLLAKLRDTVPGGSGSSQDAICDSGNSELTGLFQTIEEDNTIRITTNGECIKPPENKSFCEVQPETDDNGDFVETGIHALTDTEIFSIVFSGYDAPPIPGFPNPLDSIAQSFANKVCILHVPEHFTKAIVETDICLDLTDQVGDLPGVTPPVTVAFEGSSTSMIVDDCFQTNADTITNLVTKETWVNQLGRFIPLN